jgi:hypothetical protein
MSLVDQNNPAFWADGSPRSMYTGFTRGLSGDQFAETFKPSPKARTNPGGRGIKRPIDQLTRDGEFVRQFPSICEAARAVGAPDPNIVRAASGRRITAGGYRWRYAEEAAA